MGLGKGGAMHLILLPKKKGQVAESSGHCDESLGFINEGIISNS